MLEAEPQFRKIIGDSDLARLALALAVEHDLTARRSPTTHPPRPSGPIRSSASDHRGSPPRSSTTHGTSSSEDVSVSSPLPRDDLRLAPRAAVGLDDLEPHVVRAALLADHVGHAGILTAWDYRLKPFSRLLMT